MRKKLLLLPVLLLAIIAAVNAEEDQLSLQSPLEASSFVIPSVDEECKQQGFDYGIARYHYNCDQYVRIVRINGFSTAITGTDTLASWVANPEVAGLIVKDEAGIKTIVSGGASGTIDISALSIGKITKVTFCGRDTNEVPEFSAVGVVIIISILSLFMLIGRRKPSSLRP